MDPLRRAIFRLASLWRNLRHRRAVDEDLDAELTAAFDALVDDHVKAGMPPTDARRAATLELGRVASIQTQVREVRSGAGVESVWHDVRFGARMLRRSPLFTFTAVLSLGLGIGANTTIFSVVNVLMLRDLDVPEPQQLLEIGRLSRGGFGGSFSYPAYELLRDQNSVFTGVLALSKETVQGNGRFVSGNFFEVMRVAPLAGRLLSPGDDRLDSPQGPALAVITYGLWRREFGGSVAAIGQSIRVDSIPFTIIGVLPATFEDLIVGRPADFFIPIASEALLRHDSVLGSAASSWIGIVGRLKPGVASDGALANLEPIWSRFLVDLTADIPDAEARQRIRSQRLLVQSGSRGLSDVRRDFAKPVLLLMAAVSLVLFIACANVINLLLARGVARRREIALRLAIGASRARLLRQLLTESMLLGAAGAVLGLAIAGAGAPLLVWLVSQSGSPLDLDVAPDLRVLLFTAAISVGSSLLAGVLPALRTARADMTPSFGRDARSVPVTRESARWGRALIAAQVALSLLLVVGASLLVATLRNIRSVHPGFEARNVVLLRVDPARVGYTGDRLTRYYRDVLERVRTIGGVQAASLSMVTPISGGGIDQPITVEGRAREPGAMILANRMSEGFFATMMTPLLLGRDFVPADGVRGPAVAIVNDALARRYFAGKNPIGRRITLGDRIPREIIGVAANAKYFSLRDADTPTAYVYTLDTPDHGGLTLSVRTSGDPLAAAPAIRGQVESVAAGVPVSPVRTLAGQVERSLVTERLVARLLGAFAVLSLLLASVGLYGVLGYYVVRRTAEIGLRLALGATRGAVLQSVLRQSLTVVAIGSAAGIPAAMLSSRLLSSLLYGVTSSDVRVLAGAVASVFAVAIIAAALPAWRASRVDPLVALRHE